MTTKEPHHEESKAPNKEMAKMVDKLFQSVERRLQMPEFGGIVDDALKCSVFG